MNGQNNSKYRKGAALNPHYIQQVLAFAGLMWMLKPLSNAIIALWWQTKGFVHILVCNIQDVFYTIPTWYFCFCTGMLKPKSKHDNHNTCENVNHVARIFLYTFTKSTCNFTKLTKLTNFCMLVRIPKSLWTHNYTLAWRYEVYLPALHPWQHRISYL